MNGTAQQDSASTAEAFARIDTLGRLLARDRNVRYVAGSDWHSAPNQSLIVFPREKLAQVSHDEATGSMWRAAGFLTEGTHAIEPYDAAVDICARTRKIYGSVVAHPAMLLPVVAALETERIERICRQGASNLSKTFLPPLGSGWRAAHSAELQEVLATPPAHAQEWWQHAAIVIAHIAAGATVTIPTDFAFLTGLRADIEQLVSKASFDDLMNDVEGFALQLIAQYVAWTEAKLAPPPPQQDDSAAPDSDEQPSEEDADAQGTGDPQGDDSSEVEDEAPSETNDNDEDEAHDGDETPDSHQGVSEVDAESDEQDSAPGDGDDAESDEHDDSAPGDVDDVESDNADGTAETSGDENDGAEAPEQDDAPGSATADEGEGDTEASSPLSDAAREQLERIVDEAGTERLEIDFLHGTIGEAGTSGVTLPTLPSGASWSNVANDVRPQVDALRGVLVKYLEQTDVSEREHGRRNGRIDRRRIASLVNATSSNVFTSRALAGDTSIDVYLVLDTSYSMRDKTDVDLPLDVFYTTSGQRFHSVQRFTVAVMEALSKIEGCRIGVITFQNEAKVVHRLGNLLTAETKQTILDTVAAADNGTNLASALRLATTELQDSQAERQLIIVATDGDIGQELDPTVVSTMNRLGMDYAIFTVDVPAVAAAGLIDPAVITELNSTNITRGIEPQFRRLFS